MAKKENEKEKIEPCCDYCIYSSHDLLFDYMWFCSHPQINHGEPFHHKGCDRKDVNFFVKSELKYKMWKNGDCKLYTKKSDSTKEK